MIMSLGFLREFSFIEINKKSSSYLCDHTIKFVNPKLCNIQCRVSGGKIHEKHNAHMVSIRTF